MTEFQVRLNCIDHYQAPFTLFDPPLGDGTGNGAVERSRVPIVRVFGSTPQGQKVCAHVHGMFPYIYVQYEDDADPGSVADYLHRLQLSIDHALAVSYRRNDKNPFVAHVSFVKGVPFYGYYVGYSFFVKIYLYNPMHVTRLADLLRQGAVMGKAMQPHESHMQYVPQWMCDYNLFGCDYLRCSQVTYRSPVPSHEDVSVDGWHDESIPGNMIVDEDQLPRQSHCDLEVDICVQHILNRHDTNQRSLHHCFDEATSSPPPTEKLVTSMAGLWRDETRRRKRRMGIINENDTPFSADVLLSVSADPRDTNHREWIHEVEYRRKIRDLIEAEEQGASEPATFSNFLKPVPLEDNVQTSFESVEDLYRDKLEATLAARQGARDKAGLSGRPVEDMLEVDEARVLSLADDTGADDNFGQHPVKDEIEKIVDSVTTNDLKAVQDILPDNSSPSKDLEGLGVRGAGDCNHSVEDAFEIPLEFIGSEHIVARRPEKRSFSPDHGRRKRQKLVQFVDKAEVVDVPLEALETQDAVSDVGEAEKSKGSKMIGSVRSEPKSIGSAVPAEDAQPLLESNNSRSLNLSSEAENRANSVLVSNSTESSHDRSIRASVRLDNLVQQLEPGTFIYPGLPPSVEDVMLDLRHSGLGTKEYMPAHYGDDKDVPTGSREYAGREFRLLGSSTKFLPEFDAYGDQPSQTERMTKASQDLTTSLTQWEIAARPPSAQEVEAWVESSNTKPVKPEPHQYLSQIEGPTQTNKHGLVFSQRKRSANVMTEAQYMSVLSVEIHVNTRGDLLPDPRHDEVVAIFWCLQFDSGGDDVDNFEDKVHTGALVFSTQAKVAALFRQLSFGQIDEEDSELDLFTTLVDVVRGLDPDVLTGYEVHNGSWGYLIERARVKFDYGLCDELSKVKSDAHGRFGKEADRWGFNMTSTIRVTGRHMINIWRAMRGELALLQYTMENVAFQVLNRRIPHYTHSDLTRWFQSGKPGEIHKVINYWKTRTIIDLEILDRNELIPRTSEQARLLGVDFYAVFSRGSQFKVESLMFRIAKPENFIIPSPGRKQVGQQNALECLPLVMEPQSDFYTSPVLVLDFQSLYPSVMIAYNYCYSTFMGRVTPWRGQNKMGFSEFHRKPQLLELLEKSVNIAPNGIMYAKSDIRKSLLAKMLGEILETRVMVKSGMKVDKDDRQLQRLLNNRQLALKLIANVTYGYTSASFSGRMPCSEIADSIVQTGRETLERTIAFIHSVRKWRAEVVYGDTDSLFIHLKNRTRDEAFEIGQDIAQTITDMNPRPIKLKFEKVYQPCVLLAKKRYVGFKYETREQTEPEFDAKGIETVRRDGTPAEQKIEEAALKILFRTADLSQVKRYFQRQCTKIMQGRVSVQDFCYAREVKLGSYSDKGPAPPGALISARRMLNDPRAEPQYGERVPYVVVAGAPGARLIDRCVAPEVVLRDDQVDLDADYYISKNIIPPLERIFNLVGANVRQWYDEMPKLQRARRIRPMAAGGGGKVVAKKTIDSYMRPTSCILCGSRLAKNSRQQQLCRKCRAQPAQALFDVRTAIARDEARMRDLLRVCRSCADLAFGEEVKCDSKDCPVFYSRVRHEAQMGSRQAAYEEVAELLEKVRHKGFEW